jgi:hypothetical protein
MRPKSYNRAEAALLVGVPLAWAAESNSGPRGRSSGASLHARRISATARRGAEPTRPARLRDVVAAGVVERLRASDAPSA